MRFATRVVVAGVVLESAAVLQQLQWHAAHGGDAEPFGDLVAAHAPIDVGAALCALGGALVLARDGRRAAWWAALFVVAALVRVGALALDARLHGAGADASSAHDVYRAGVALALVAGVWRVVVRNARVAFGRVQARG